MVENHRSSLLPIVHTMRYDSILRISNTMSNMKLTKTFVFSKKMKFASRMSVVCSCLEICFEFEVSVCKSQCFVWTCSHSKCSTVCSYPDQQFCLSFLLNKSTHEFSIASKSRRNRSKKCFEAIMEAASQLKVLLYQRSTVQLESLKSLTHL